MNQNIIERIGAFLRGILSEKRTRMIAIAFAAIVIGVIVASSVLISTAGNDDSGVIAVSGGAESGSVATKGEAGSNTITTTNGSPVLIKVSVAEGSTSLVDINYDDDNTYSGTPIGPWERDFTIANSFKATFGNPEAVTVSENGNALDIKVNDDGTGTIELKIENAGAADSGQGA